jgi:hypothetical protein
VYSTRTVLYAEGGEEDESCLTIDNIAELYEQFLR